MMSDFKPTICIDFDGVIHSYERGWQGGEIYGTVVPGFFEWATKASKTMDLVVYSSRSKEREGTLAMANWLISQAAAVGWQLTMPFDEDMRRIRLLHAWDANVIVLRFAHEKPAAWITIDDRAIRFTGDWADSALTVESLLAFRPWNSNT